MACAEIGLSNLRVVRFQCNLLHNILTIAVKETKLPDFCKLFLVILLSKKIEKDFWKLHV